MKELHIVVQTDNEDQMEQILNLVDITTSGMPGVEWGYHVHEEEH